MMSALDELKYDANGLIPAIVQDDQTGEILMMAYMNKASLAKTVETGKTHFWSRSRQKYWMKGESSNHVQEVKAIYTDEFQAAATGPQYRYMRLLAHLPLLLAPQQDGAEVLVICFGTGTTAGSASVHPIGGLDIVEISPEVLDLADYFRHANKGVLDEDPDRVSL